MLIGSLKGHKNMAEIAKWEHKTDRTIKRNIMRNAIDDMRKRKATDLRSRKARLADLLAAEDKMYEQEFLQSLETPEQVRAKMAERLETLKTKREEERSDLVKQALDRKFKMETDDLRKEETNFLIAGCQIEREKQLQDKRQKLQGQIVEEQVYAKLWMLDADKKAERERREAIEKQKKVSDTVNILTWQTDQRQTQAEIEKAKRVQEQTMLQQQWTKELEADKEAQRQQFVLNRERNLELINHNAAERELRAL